ncbi:MULTISPECIES: 16S rRNA (guanine(966)-N(2))-methyltransferase RsmD [unclassified Sporosarcina]|uniref:16S rRNA (guanine(966)-N(2))-methyltransferase RsmD n=1 Tax=unclassified Sporosarcina TaxID=2647733 RepID=UPI000C172FEA|nr:MULTISPECIES: 16S rRNA (guanine(966)-N(2))-methyltransferase RsmD [unclassified Sporosarcina]PID06751.1 16S rRNA (guanine(966)-N(2))-methyltransferase RsmD [Sporosarcina sp. P30]PID09946.1 16S rRNA (guanine(966)-N(2))-methyltransferase RsmD [Sporosarcina sp. P31]PID13525.1 16S rRNA (guanine(966)-N(2))-methyltransferase RsmD [Sporosarcina sp. P32b]
MRVISGSRKGTTLKSLPGTSTRPTSDKVKESVFNKIGPYFDGGIVVELFGGSGSIAIEALSRGMEQAIVFEKNPKACAIIKTNAEKCRMEESLRIEKKDARQAAAILKQKEISIDLLFVDPPYATVEYYDVIKDVIAQGLLAEDATIICEHDKHIDLPEQYDTYSQISSAVYGSTAITIYKKRG